MIHRICLSLSFTMLFCIVALVSSPFAVAEDAKAEAASEKIDVDGLELVVPKDWKKEQPKSRLRTAQFRLGDASDEKNTAELAVFKFGASSVQQNIERWIGQYQAEGRTVKVTHGKSPQAQYIVVELSGTHKKSIGPPIQRKTVDVPGSRSFNVILQVPEKGMFFLKLVGPDAYVASQGDALRAAFGGDAEGEKEIELGS